MGATDRRDFLKAAATIAAASAISPVVSGQDQPTGERVVVGVMGTGSRGTQLASGFAALPNVVVKYVCDVDEAHANAAAKTVAAKAAANKDSPAPINDFKRILDDREVHAIAIATPDHWHAPAAILAASAGKHVYVEKPCCHNPREGELLLAAQKKSNRVMQQGSQRRSWPKVIEAIDKVKQGAIGKVLFSRGWYTNNRPTIGIGKPADPPKGLDWALWQGPAPDMPFHDNYVPYNWHWFWQWGTGECGNNGIHALDLCRWGLAVDCPKKVVSAGGRYHYQDDWQTPDTQFVTFDHGDKVIHWEGRSCHPRGVENGAGFGVGFYGDQGSLILDSGAGYAIYDLKNKEVAKVPGVGNDAVHLQNFVEAIRTSDPTKLNAPISEAVPSVLLCHLANISQRTGRALNLDTEKRQITGDADAMKLWSREYRPGMEPSV